MSKKEILGIALGLLVFSLSLIGAQLSMYDPAFVGTIRYTPSYLYIAPTNWIETNTVYIAVGGLASNVYRPFTNASWVATDSYGSISAAQGGVNPLSALEFDGGTNGFTYTNTVNIVQKMILRGSQLPGHNGKVTITRTSSPTLRINAADDVILQNLTLDGNNANRVLQVDQAAIIRNCYIINAGAGLENMYIDAGAKLVSVINCVFGSPYIPGDGNQSRILSLNNLATNNFYDCTLDFFDKFGYQNFGTGISSFYNCDIENVTDANGDLSTLLWTDTTNGVINTYNCNLGGALSNPHSYFSGNSGITGIWNQVGVTLTNMAPRFTQNRSPGGGYICLEIDDRGNFDYATNIAYYAMGNYGIPINYMVSDTQNLTAGQKTVLQAMYLAGHGIGAHSRNHTTMTATNALTITYSGLGVDNACVVSTAGTNLTLTGTLDSHVAIDLTTAPNNTLTGVAATIGGYANYACSVNIGGGVAGTCDSGDLNTGTNSLPASTAVGILFDTSTNASNRYFTSEVLGSINDLNNAITNNPACSNYSCISWTFPSGVASQLAWGWIQTNSPITVIKAVQGAGFSDQSTKGYLNNINLFNLGYSMQASTVRGGDTNFFQALPLLEQARRLRASAISMTRSSAKGWVVGWTQHNFTSGDLSTSQMQTWLDEAQLYRTDGAQFVPFYSLQTNITTSGNWSNAGAGLWTRTQNQFQNYLPKTGSGLIGQALDISNRVSDIVGTPVSVTKQPDIGAYEKP